MGREDIPYLSPSGGEELEPFELMGTETRARKGRINGIVLGVVTNNQDEENLGRVKVKFPWLGEGYESGWVRMATLMAGNERGTFFLPEVGDEVVVAFDHGDIDYPYVIGALWNGKDKPPETNDTGENNVRKITSRSGHELIFDDASGKEKVEIHTKSGNAVLLDDGGKVIEVKTKGGLKITLDDNSKTMEMVAGGSSIKMESGGITISCNGKLVIDASTIEMKAKAKMDLSGNAGVAVKSSGLLTIEGSLVKIN